MTQIGSSTNNCLRMWIPVKTSEGGTSYIVVEDKLT